MNFALPPTSIKMASIRNLQITRSPAATVRLTIDSRIQRVAEQELAKAIVKHHSKTGSMVVMDPKTGDILAMASYPTFDPNEPLTPAQDLSVRTNLAISTPFEPGSVVKVITVSTALETTRLRPETMINCGNGSITLYGRTIHDHKSYPGAFDGRRSRAFEQHRRHSHRHDHRRPQALRVLASFPFGTTDGHPSSGRIARHGASSEKMAADLDRFRSDGPRDHGDDAAARAGLLHHCEQRILCKAAHHLRNSHCGAGRGPASRKPQSRCGR